MGVEGCGGELFREGAQQSWLAAVSHGPGPQGRRVNGKVLLPGAVAKSSAGREVGRTQTHLVEGALSPARPSGAGAWRGSGSTWESWELGSVAG